jgi:hypothetical protein
VLVISDVGDIRALFGERIHIVPPRNTAALASAMEAAASDPHPSADYLSVIDQVAISSVAGAMLTRLGVQDARPSR